MSWLHLLRSWSLRQTRRGSLPGTNDLYDLGSTALRFRDLYLGGDTLHLGTSLTDEATFGYNTTSNILNIGTDGTTNGDIAFFSDDLYLDKSTGRVGIGTTTPSSMLHISGDGTARRGIQLSQTTAATSWTLNNYETGASEGAGNFGINQVGVGARFVIDTSGNVGIGTSTPSAKLDIYGTAGSSYIFAISSSTNSRLFTVTAAGNVGIGTTNPNEKLSINVPSSGYAGIEFREGDGSAYGAKVKYDEVTGTLRLTGNENNTEKLGIAIARATGKIGIGTASPAAPLHVKTTQANTNQSFTVTLPVVMSDGIALNSINDANSANKSMEFNASAFAFRVGNVGIGQTTPNQGKLEVKGGTVCVDTDSDDNASSCIASESDERLKTNIQTLSASSSVDIINALNPVSFDWRVDDADVAAHYPLIQRFADNPHSIGLIAQEVELTLPEALALETVGDDEVQYFQLDYTKFIPHIIGAIKELYARVLALVDAVSGHEQRISELEAEVAALRAQQSASAASGPGASMPSPDPEEAPVGDEANVALEEPAPAPEPEPSSDSATSTDDEASADTWENIASSIAPLIEQVATSSPSGE